MDITAKMELQMDCTFTWYNRQIGQTRNADIHLCWSPCWMPLSEGLSSALTLLITSVAQRMGLFPPFRLTSEELVLNRSYWRQSGSNQFSFFKTINVRIKKQTHASFIKVRPNVMRQTIRESNFTRASVYHLQKHTHKHTQHSSFTIVSLGDISSGRHNAHAACGRHSGISDTDVLTRPRRKWGVWWWCPNKNMPQQSTMTNERQSYCTPLTVPLDHTATGPKRQVQTIPWVDQLQFPCHVWQVV